MRSRNKKNFFVVIFLVIVVLLIPIVNYFFVQSRNLQKEYEVVEGAGAVVLMTE